MTLKTENFVTTTIFYRYSKRKTQQNIGNYDSMSLMHSRADCVFFVIYELKMNGRHEKSMRNLSEIIP